MNIDDLPVIKEVDLGKNHKCVFRPRTYDVVMQIIGKGIDGVLNFDSFLDYVPGGDVEKQAIKRARSYVKAIGK